MTRYYRGWSDEKQCWEVFGWDDREEPDTEDTGYSAHEGPWDRKGDVPGEEDDEE